MIKITSSLVSDFIALKISLRGIFTRPIEELFRNRWDGCDVKVQPLIDPDATRETISNKVAPMLKEIMDKEREADKQK